MKAPSFDPCGLALRAEDATRVDLVRLAEEFDEDGHLIDGAGPAEAGLLLLEASLLEVVLQRSVRLWRLVAEGETDDEIHVRRAYMGSRTFGELTDQVSRGQAARQVDALSPRAEVAEEGDQHPLAAPRRLLVVTGVVLPHQNPITSRRRCSACSRPRRGSWRSSA